MTNKQRLEQNYSSLGRYYDKGTVLIYSNKHFQNNNQQNNKTDIP